MTRSLEIWRRSKTSWRRTQLIFGLLTCSVAVASAEATDCGALTNAYGPFDYTNPMHRQESLPVVERYHFDDGVKRLESHAMRPNAGVVRLGGDIDYTLRAFPNHHAALYTMVMYYTDERASSRPPMRYSADCYFDRALRHKPDDSTVRMIYGIYLDRQGKLTEAIDQLEIALNIGADSAEVHYNIGLLYFKRGDFEKSKDHAMEAYRLGYPLAGLREKLRSVGAWGEES